MFKREKLKPAHDASEIAQIVHGIYAEHMGTDQGAPEERAEAANAMLSSPYETSLANRPVNPCGCKFF